MAVTSNIGDKIGDGGIAEVFARDNKAIKLYKPHVPKSEAFYEALINTIIESTGLPVPKVFSVHQVSDRWAMEMELLDGSILSKLIKQQPADTATYLDTMIDMHMRIHNIKDLPIIFSQKQKIESRIRNVSILSVSQKENLISELKNMPDGNCLCHGDYHYNNLIMNNGRVFIIDWVDATIGNPAADVCRTYMLFKIYAPGIADTYIEKYSNNTDVSIDEIKVWLPFVAASRLSEGKDEEIEQLLKWI